MTWDPRFPIHDEIDFPPLPQEHVDRGVADVDPTMIINFHANRLADEGIASIRRTEPPERQDAMVAGFEACRGIRTRYDAQQILSEWRNRDVVLMMRITPPVTDEAVAAYWENRYGTIQVEYVYARLDVWFVALERALS